MYELQVDQGLGIGSKFPFFNRHQLTLTRFIQLKEVEEGAGKPPPPVLVLNGHYGGCVGDLPSYDAFTLGGPYSVRGYNMGELGAARNILEVSFTGDNILPRIKMNCVVSGSYLMFLLKMEPLQELIVCRW
jgi:outer membrane protein assembly factor BamA